MAGGVHPGGVEAGVGAAGGDQLVVVAVLDEPAVVEHEHPVGARRRRQAVGDGDRRAPLGEVAEGARDAHLGERVDRRRRLVEDEHVGVGDAGPQQGDELALAGRQLLAALAD